MYFIKDMICYKNHSIEVYLKYITVIELYVNLPAAPAPSPPLKPSHYDAAPINLPPTSKVQN